MRPWYLSDVAINKFIDSALAEDIGEGDHSTLGAVPANQSAKAQLLVKQDCILAGLEIAERTFHRVDPALKIQFFKQDGDQSVAGDIAFYVEGKAQSILTAERFVLNCMQRMSGIATLTNRLAGQIKNTRARLMDTRKTTPNFRLMEKWAVHIGGGINHRFALYDMVMLKDNHIDSAGGILNAVESVRQYFRQTGKELKIEVETRTMDEVREAMAQGVDIIMLDNMNLSQIKEAVKLVNGKCKLEASGGITEENLKAIAEAGVDFISMGALTHSVKSVDLSLKIVR